MGEIILETRIRLNPNPSTASVNLRLLDTNLLLLLIEYLNYFYLLFN